jgi:hypothetical protein
MTHGCIGTRVEVLPAFGAPADEERFGMQESMMLSWDMFGPCGEIRCEARTERDGFQLSLLNEGVLLSIEWVPDAATLLHRSSEVRRRLKSEGFTDRRPRNAVLHGGPSWGPDRPSTTLVRCLR